MSNLNNTYHYSVFDSYGLALLILNLLNYLIVFSLLVSIILLCDTIKFKTINQFKDINTFNFILYSTIFSLLSMAGIPPLLGFTGKFLTVLYTLHKSQYVIILLLLCINIFSMYFYIQNIRFTISKKKKNILKFKNYYVNINYSLILNIIILNFFNIFGIFFLNDCLIIVNYITSFIFL